MLAIASGVLLVSCGERSAAPAAVSNTIIKPPSGGEMVLLPAGEFSMGRPGRRADEVPHTVAVASFYLDRYPVTQELFEKVTGTNPSKRKGKQNPAERIQWVDAARFCNACSEREGLAPCYDVQTWECRFDANGYRLPTEAEWEYACRAGSRATYFFGDDASKASGYAWFKPHSAGTAHPVGQKRPNAWGLHDMLGNVWEWCNDWYAPEYYKESPRDNPHGPAAGAQRVLRGGAWDCGPEKCTTAYRAKEFPVFTDACFGSDTYGFRRARALAGAPAAPSAQAAAQTSGPAAAPATAPAAPPVSSTGAINVSRLTGTILFVSDRSGTFKIWSMRADGTEPRPLTQGSDPDADPRFSPDGQRILYTTLRGGFPEVWVVRRDGSDPQKVTAGCQADWSPDGRQIAFIRDNQVWTRELASGQERRVSPEAWERCGVPAWRPDGQALAIASRHTGTIGIYLLSLDGKKLAPLMTEDAACTPRWSKGGERLLCQTVKGHVHQVGADGKNWEQVTFGADLQHEARYSPDGSMLIFCRAPSSEGPWQICVGRLGGDETDAVPLTSEGSNLSPDWRADDSQPAPAPRKEERMQTSPTTAAPQPTAFLFDPRFLEHHVSAGHPERPQRLDAIVKRLKDKGLADRLLALAAAPAEERWLTAVHTPEYVKRVKRACSECGDGIRFIDTPDVPVSARSYEAASLAAGGVLAAVDAVADGRARNAFCAVRPPGHHALKDRAMGFCIFGNVAIAARYIQQKHRLGKVLIVDWDVHHGNGTQRDSYGDPTILHFDVHRSPFYPGSGGKEEKGEGQGAGFKINVPLSADSTDKDYREVFVSKLKPAALAFRPDFVLISAGFDAHRSDPLGGMKLTATGYAELTRIVKDIAENCCQGRLVSVLEGGYDLEALADSVEAHVRVLMEPAPSSET